MHTVAPETRPAPGESPTSRTASTPPAAGSRISAAGAKAGEELPSATAPVTRPAPYGHPAGPEIPPVSGPATSPPHEHPEQKAEYDMSTEAHRDAVAADFARRGIRAITAEEYTRQGMLDALRESRRRQGDTAQARFLTEASQSLAADISEVVDLPPADIASVLLAVGGAGGVLADMYGLRGTTFAGLLQWTADELDQRAKRGEQP